MALSALPHPPPATNPRCLVNVRGMPNGVVDVQPDESVVGAEVRESPALAMISSMFRKIALGIGVVVLAAVAAYHVLGLRVSVDGSGMIPRFLSSGARLRRARGGPRAAACAAAVCGPSAGASWSSRDRRGGRRHRRAVQPGGSHRGRDSQRAFATRGVCCAPDGRVLGPIFEDPVEMADTTMGPS